MADNKRGRSCLRSRKGGFTKKGAANRSNNITNFNKQQNDPLPITVSEHDYSGNNEIVNDADVNVALNVTICQQDDKNQITWEQGRRVVELSHMASQMQCDNCQTDLHLCDIIGKKRLAKGYKGGHSFAIGSADFWLDDVKCNGSEIDIAKCSHRQWGGHNCQQPTETAAAGCEPINLRLRDGNVAEGQLLETNQNGQWYPVCDEYLSSSGAYIVCSIMGYKVGKQMTTMMGNNAKTGTYYNFNTTCFENSTICTTNPFSSTSCSQGQPVYVKCLNEYLTHIRLAGGSVPSEGRVEIMRNGIWGSICTRDFSILDARVICDSLGFSGKNVTLLRSGVFGFGDGPGMISSLSCYGNEKDIALCHNSTFTETVCDRAHEVTMRCEPTAVRLVGGAGPWEGRLNVQHAGQWYDVCTNGFSRQTADLICKLLGFQESEVTVEVKVGNYYGAGNETNMISELNCTGKEIDLSLCPYSSLNNCPPTRNVGLRCQSKDVRLRGGSHGMEGTVEVRIDGEWTTICDDQWDDLDATAVCKMLTEYPVNGNVTGVAHKGAFFGAGRGRIIMSGVDCHGTENNIFSCNSDRSGGINCDHSRDAGVTCKVNNSVVLSGRSKLESTGTVNIVEGRHWNSLCDKSWTEHDAEVVCRSLGYWSSSPILYQDSWFGRANGTSLDLDLLCTGTESNVAFCRMNKEWGRSSCSHSDDAGVGCITTALGFHKVRLVNGSTAGNGRLEVLYNNNWGSVCFDNWTQKNTDTVCKMMHYRNTTVVPRSFSVPKAATRVLVGSLICHGNESDIGYCRADLNKENCAGSVVGIDCTVPTTCMEEESLVYTYTSPSYLNSISMTSGMNARLTETLTPLSGRVQIYKNGTWGEVCANDLNDKAAKVLCSMIGFKNAPAKVISAPHPTGSHNVLKINDLQCDGWEAHIQQCVFQDGGVCADVGAHIQCFNCSQNSSSTHGNFTSFGYPNGFSAGTDCIYEIKPMGHSNQKYKLVVNDLDLNSHDTLEITDGENGQHLMTLSSNPPYIPILGSSQYVLRFKSDTGSTHRRGFWVHWSPLTVEDAITVECDPSSWRIIVNMTILRQLYPDSGVSQMYLSKQACYGHVIDDTVVFDQSYANCSTTKSVSDNYVSYFNQLVYPESSTPFPLIVHSYRWRVNVQCDLNRVDYVTQHYKPTEAPPAHTTIHHNIGGTGHYDINLKFYTDPQFFHEIKGNPITANIGENVYVKVTLNSNDYGTKMRLDTCDTKPSPGASSKSTYVIIRNGCSVDPSTQITAQGTHETRFLFNAFVFPSNQNAVYVSCNATFCSTSDQSSKCTQTCHQTRRQLSSDNMLPLDSS